jgi:hypothetical protein
MKRLLLGTCLVAALFAASAAPAAARATQEMTRTVETIGPELIGGFTCLEASEDLVMTSTQTITTHLVQTMNGLHSFYSVHYETRMVPADGSGRIYVGHGSSRSVVNGSPDDGDYVESFVSNDRIVAYQGGKVDATFRVRVHETYKLVFRDTDGDGVVDVQVEVEKLRFSCP